jgi:hypothetical protein
MTPHWSVSKKSEPEKPVPPKVPMSKKVLYVDDDKDWRDVVSVTFQDDGYEVLTANNAT